MAIIAICVALLFAAEAKDWSGHKRPDVYEKCHRQSDCQGSFCSITGYCHPCEWCQNCNHGIDRTCGPCGKTTDGHDCNGCANWCLTDGSDWSQKCSWDQCAGCDKCKTPCTFDVEMCNDECTESCTELRIGWDDITVNPETTCNTCPSQAQLEANFCSLAKGPYLCHPGAPDYEEVKKVRFYVSEAHGPHRMKISKDPQCCGWTDKFSFYAYESEGVPDTTGFFVSEAHRPHRFKISTEPQCCGWTDVFKFYAYTKKSQTWATDAVRFYVSEAHGPHRMKISKDPQCCGWTDKFEFWADEEAVESALGTENEKLMVANKALRQALEELTQS